MKRFWQQFLAPLTPGTRTLLIVLTAVALASAIGQMIGAFDLNDGLGFSGQKIGRGQLWRLLTYALLPGGLVFFILNAYVLVLVGGWLERNLSYGEMWAVCIISVLGAGLTGLLVKFPLSGTGPMVFGLLAAWGFLCAREKTSVLLLGELVIWQLALLAGAASLLIAIFSCGWQNAATLAAGGASGFLYAWLAHKRVMNRASRVVPSERISRLEL